MREMHLEALDIFLRLCAAGVLGAVIGSSAAFIARQSASQA
jgi:hypothetical protein